MDFLMEATENGCSVFMHYLPEWDGSSKKMRSPFSFKEKSLSLKKGRDGKTWVFRDWKMDETYKGDFMSFVMLYENMEYKDALKHVFRIFIDENE